MKKIAHAERRHMESCSMCAGRLVAGFYLPTRLRAGERGVPSEARFIRPCCLVLGFYSPTSASGGERGVRSEAMSVPSLLVGGVVCVGVGA
jgi:hypothetical protein